MKKEKEAIEKTVIDKETKEKLKAEKKAAKEKAAQVKKEAARLRKEAKVKKEKAVKKAKNKADKQVEEVKFTAQAVKEVRGGSKRSIMQTLLIGFLVPVAMMIVLGIVCYNTAASGMVSKYQESAESTVSAVGNYCDLICSSLSSKALELIGKGDVADYFERYYKKQDTKSIEAMRNAKTLLGNAKATNKYMFSYSVIPEGGAYLTSLTGSMTENPHDDFLASKEGQYLSENKTIRNAWLGYHSYIDSNLKSQEDDYAIAFYQKFAKGDSYLVFDISMDVVKDMLAQMDFGNGTVRAIVSSDGREIVSIQGKEDEPVEDTWFVGQSFFENSRQQEETIGQDVKVNGKKYVYLSTPVGNTGIMICALIPRSNLMGQANTIRVITIIMVILAAAAAMATGGFISIGISREVKSMTLGISKVAEGDLSSSFDTKRKDEFGILSASLNKMLESMRMLMQDMQKFGLKVREMAVDVSERTENIDDSIKSTSQAMDEVAKGVQSQAEETESSNEKMIAFSDNITAVTDQTSQMEKTADKAIEAVGEGRDIVQELNQKSASTVSLTKMLVENINEVEKNSEEIKSFVEVINSIAGQTNLLSLNASIEAARAGEAGRGFAVVAEEIRKLADQSKESGNKIQDIVSIIGSTTQRTTESAKRAETMVQEQAQALIQTVEVFGRIQECVGELVEGIKMTLNRLQQITDEKVCVQDSIQNISSVSEQVAASTQEVTATLGEQTEVIGRLAVKAEELSREAEELDKSIARFKL
ncbi:MAG: methyl-accepting chemotaxis protein [Bacillota bacterium]|nr:methyl-accepting chemotaxis protein [Bacillota bacterium]